MGSREITIWIDERWYDALSKQLEDETLEDHLGDVLDKMCNQLPENVYESISRQILEERQRDRELQEAVKRYAVFHVNEHGQESYMQVKRGLELLDAARLLRMYLCQERGASEFRQMLHAAEYITKDAFYDRIQERVENTGKVTGAFELDFDRQEFSALNIMEGWKVYTMKDVSAAVYYVDRKRYLPSEERWGRLHEKLTGKELTVQSSQYLSGSRRLLPEEISFADEIMWNSRRLEFYMPVTCDTEAVFGSALNGMENINLYAFFDLDNKCVVEDLEVDAIRPDGVEVSFKYHLSTEEQETVRQKMSEHCIRSGMSLDECCDVHQREPQERQRPMEQQM